MRKTIFKGKGERIVAAALAGIMLNMSMLPYLPGNLTAYGFGLAFVNSGTPGSPYLKGRVEGEGSDSWFLCLNHGAAANSQMDYSKINADVDYAKGTLEQKKLFWAYIGAFGSYDGDWTIIQRHFPRSISRDEAKKVAWKEGENAWVNQKINEFAMLDNVPEGAKSAKEVLDTVMVHKTPETALPMYKLLESPGVISKEKLFEKAGVKDWEYFKEYCDFQALPYEYNGKRYEPQVVEGTTGIFLQWLEADTGLPPAVGETDKHPPTIIKVTYNPAIFKVLEVSGRIEYFKASKADGSPWPGAQQLARVKGHVEESYPVFYITTGKTSGQPILPDTGEDNGHLNGGEGIDVKIYQHSETFESNYHVELTKKDYETGYPLQNAIWQVLEAFPDQTELGDDETGGALAEANMREAPTTWKNWLIFEDDMKTDENGCISHSDQRYYDFRHTYCNGHPEPPEPDPPAGDDPDAQADYEDAMAEYEALMEEWRAAVKECDTAARKSSGTHHHWIVGGTKAASEAQAFEKSGCRQARDSAYENFINLRYSYTFREVEARNGYIIHGQNGHPDDVPIEIITTASSEAGKSYEWTKCSNEDIIVEGYARDQLSGDGKEDEEGEEAGAAGAAHLINTISGQPIKRRAATDSESSAGSPYLTEDYDLSFGDKAVQALRRFIGLPESLASGESIAINVVAEYDEVYDPALDEEVLENDLKIDGDNSQGTGQNNIDSASPSNTATDKGQTLTATPSNSYRATPSNTEDKKKPAALFRAAKPSDRADKGENQFAVTSEDGGGYIDLDSPIGDSQPAVDPGPADKMLHSWIVYDHRVPGQIHINKKDMELAAGETKEYDAYGDTQGDAALEGAVYGLFAADPIYGPDTQRNPDGSVKQGTGIVFDANDLVAVATTDKNGDASFLTITEKPHSIYHYKTGQIEYTGKAYPKNLYDMDGYRKEYEDEETGRIYRDNVTVNGDCWIGRPLILGSYYIKELTRSEGYELSITGKNMEITNATDENRNDYGETQDSKSYPVGTAWIEQKLMHAVTFPEANEAYGNRENLLSVEIRSNGAVNGFDVVFDGIPEGADFYFDNVKTSSVTVQVPVGGQWVYATEEPLYETAKDNTISKRDKDGNQILNPDAEKDFPVLYSGIGYEAETITYDSAAPEDAAAYLSSFTDDDENLRYVKYELEQMLRQIGVDTPYKDGYSTPDHSVFDEPEGERYGMPEFTINIDGVTTNKSLIDAILNYFVSKEVYTYGSLQGITMDGSNTTVCIAAGMNPKKALLYRKNDAGEITNAYLFKLSEATNRYVMREYSGESIVANALPGNSGKYQIYLRPDFTIDENGMPQNAYTYRPGTEYLKYSTGEVIYDYWYQDGNGSWAGHEPVRRRVYETIYEDQVVEQTDVSSSKVAVVGSREEVKDPTGSTYVYYDEVSKQYILHAGAKDADLSGEKTSGFTIALPDGSKTLTAADIEKIGDNNVWGYQAGDSVKVSEYLVRIQGAGTGVHTAAGFDKDASFIKNQRLIYNGNHNLVEDGNTHEAPNPVKERAITQEIKVTKTIHDTSYNNTNSYGDVHKDWFTETFGGLLGTKAEALKMDNFRFKTYLKSNLEGLYRDNDGNVVWLDRTGKEVDPLKVNAAFPALVNKIYTRVPHKIAPLYKDSRDAIIANGTLYSYQDGLINEDQNAGYTSVLETVLIEMEDGEKARTIEALNYDKFFDGIAVANNDKWDEAAPTYTSWKPIGNQANRNDNAIENARVSDMVRQFAIDWYLDDEIKKLVRPVLENNAETEDADGTVNYSDELYDEALRAAIIKSENYLKPFFAYDLDEIYAVAWDSEENGGRDNDLTTLSADTLHGTADNTSEGYYYGTSARLPYGTYVVVEQQPKYAGLEDFKNRHYQMDKPKEVFLPSVYASYEGSQQSPEITNDYYNYSSSMAQNEQERRYKIRFNEEALHLIKGRNAEGDFEVYKYGMDIDSIRNGVTGTGMGDYFALTQSEFKPCKNYYNLQDDRTTADVPYYLTEGLSGRGKVAKYYRYSSVAENKGTADNVPFPGGPVTEENQPGRVFKDQVVTMQGAAIAYEGKYAPMLVPWSIAAPENAATEERETRLQANGESSYKGYAYTKLRNRFFTARLRIEKLDSETHENILHDGAIFNIYAAQRDERPDGTGEVLFYEEATLISGTKEFLTAMGATDIRPIKRRASWIDRITGKEVELGDLYTGIVPAGTPICEEAEQIYLGDAKGNHTVAMKSYTTVRDGLMKDEDKNKSLVYADQTVGYLETPQPLGAGAYVIAEVKPPAGYARSKPIALEVYSDQVAYYKEGNKDERVVAAIYEYPSDDQTANATKPQDVVNVASVNVENYPIKLRVEKVKESSADTANTTDDKTVTYKVSGRVDGKLVEIGNDPTLVYAYENGNYLGYAWKKGILEYLSSRKAAGEQVELVYEGRNFAGYGYITQKLETADDVNRYVVGATVTLFDAIALNPSGDTEDLAYEGLVIERNLTNNVTRMYVKEGYAGEKVEFVQERDENGNLYEVKYPAGVNDKEEVVEAEGNIWRAETIQRPDTDILYYDLDSLAVTVTEIVDGQKILYGYDRNYKRIPLEQIESDKHNFNKTDSEYSIFAFKGGTPYLEFVGGDFTKIRYSAKDKVLEVGEGTLVYHLDRDGNRDALVDPYTGMAYVLELTSDGKEQILVWAVNIRRDEHGNIIARDKITTSRIATVGENQEGYREDITLDVSNNSGQDIPAEDRPSYEHTESGYITGTWKSETGEESHKETSVNTNQAGQNMNDEVLMDDNNGHFEKQMNPVYDSHGLPKYYQRSEETYDKSTDLYDRNGDFVRQQDSDNLEEYNHAAYRINMHEELYDGDDTVQEQSRKKLYHRLGEGYILENTWVTSDKTPNDPFHDQKTDGQADILKRLPAGYYIMEELKAPDGYLKGMPTGISVLETAKSQNVTMVDKTIKEVIDKVDGVEKYTVDVLDMNQMAIFGHPKVIGSTTEGMGTYSFGSLPGAEIALYAAEKVYTSDTVTYPQGYYLKKKDEKPIRYLSTNNRAGTPEVLTANWTTGGSPLYLEGLPEGLYVLEELKVPSGFIASEPVEVEICNTPDVQNFVMYDDHTKVEVEKYYLEDAEKKLLAGAEFTLYEAQLDENGAVIYRDGKPQYYKSKAVDSWVSGDREDYEGFIPAFEEMYRNYGVQAGTSVSWESNGQIRTAEFVSAEILGSSMSGGAESIFPTSAVVLYRTSDEHDIRITVYGETGRKTGRDFTFEYQFDYRQLPEVNRYANSYQTLEGRRRLNYLPSGAKYVLVETLAPKGYAKAEDMVLTVIDTVDVQRYHVENQEGQLIISKEVKDRKGELTGAHLGLYRADGAGEFVQAPEYLETDWITGQDGVYTERDFINNRIPDGYVQGDLKPHTIKRLDSGIYYLAELHSPGYYTTFEPVRIEYRQEDEIRIIRVTDVPVEGTVEIVKTDKEGTQLSRAVFELTAYCQNDMRTPVLTRSVSSQTGKVKVSGLPIGEIQKDGSIQPYWYKLREVTPPDGFSVNTQIFKWQFAPDKQGVSYAWGESAEESIVVTDEKTRVSISKKDFDALGDDNSNSTFVAGAKLAVYEITGRDEEDNLVYDEANPVEAWTTRQDETAHVLEGLIAGRSYLLKELQAPAGYNLMKPVMFTLSADGRRIVNISNRLNTITVSYITSGTEHVDTDSKDMDSIQSVTLKGRYAVKVTNTVTDAEGTVIAVWTASEDDYVLHEFDGLQDGAAYTITERTLYSDGTEAVTARTTRIIDFAEDGTFRVPGRKTENVTLSLAYADGIEIASFRPSENVPEQIIKNNVSPENPRITMRNHNGKPGDALDPTQAVWNTVTIVNTANITCDMNLTIRTDENTTVLDPGTGVCEGNHITFTERSVKPLESRTLSFMTEASGQEASVTAVLKHNGGTVAATKTVPVLQEDRLTIHNELTGSGKRLYADETSRFTIRLYSAAGKELKGRYAFDGSRTGTIKSGDTVTLAGNEYITIDPGLYKGIHYEVIREADGREVTAWGTTGTVPEGAGSCAVFTRWLPDTSERELFKKGKSYLLTETTAYTDGTVLESNKLQIELNDMASIEHIIASDRKTKVIISKQDITNNAEQPGNHMAILDKAGNEIASWVSTDKPHQLEGVLTPGETYILREKQPVDGYSYAADIPFTVNQDGTVDAIVMVNKPTYIQASKAEITGEEEVPGCEMELCDKAGDVILSWISTDKPKEIVGVLKAGEEYTLVERRPADGFAYAKEIKFKVSLDGSIDKIQMRDEETKLEVRKVAIATGSNAEPIKGAMLQILNEDKSPATAANTTEDFAKGQELIFESQTDFVKILCQLIAGQKYYLHEVTPASGYAYAEDMPFTISKDGGNDIVVMVDKPTHVIVSKTDITGEREQPGNHMAILDKDGKEVVSWVSTDKPKEIVGVLSAGEEYILVERRPADGFSYALEVKFKVSLDGSIDKVQMKNAETQIEILKVSEATGKPLVGAEFQILDEYGVIYDSWTSMTESHQVTGKLIADKVYYLHEVKAPAGYNRMADLEFKVPRGAETLVLTAKNKKLGGDIPSTSYITFRKMSEDGIYLPGATFEFYDSDGSLYTTAISDDAGMIKIELPADGSYTFREVKAPEGYLINPELYSFKIVNGRLESQIKSIRNVKAPDIILTKLDGEYKNPLSGAVFKIWNDTGYVATGRTDENGILNFAPDRTGVYHVQEMQAPDGYKLDDTIYELTVHPDGSVSGTTVIYNFKQPIKIGKVHASYTHRLSGRGFSAFGLNGVIIPGLPRTGDWSSISWVVHALIFMAAAWLLLVLWKKEKLEGQGGDGNITKKRWSYLVLTGILLTIFFLFAFAFQSKAAETEIARTGPETITSISAPFSDDPENHIPEEYIEQDGQSYRLENYEVVEVELPEQMITASDIITYEDVEAADQIPAQAEVEVLNDNSGAVVIKTVPLKDYEYTDYRWENDFYFPVIVEDSDADYYAMGNELIPNVEENPFEGYEDALLDYMGLNPEAYVIDAVEWTSEPWETEGIVYRQAMATGRKMVATVTARYEGLVSIEAFSAKEIHAKYVLEASVVPEITEPELESGEDSDNAGKKSLWESLLDWIMQNKILASVIALLMLLLLVALILYILSRNKKKEVASDGRKV